MEAREKELLKQKQDMKVRKQQKIPETASVNMQVVEELQPTEESKQNAAVPILDESFDTSSVSSILSPPPKQVAVKKK
jgi:hypothetical protein